MFAPHCHSSLDLSSLVQALDFILKSLTKRHVELLTIIMKVRLHLHAKPYV